MPHHPPPWPAQDSWGRHFAAVQGPAESHGIGGRVSSGAPRADGVERGGAVPGQPGLAAHNAGGRASAHARGEVAEERARDRLGMVL